MQTQFEMTTSLYPHAWLGSWRWQGMDVSFVHRPPETTGCDSGASAVILIHGFGACKEHWRHNVEPLGGDRHVYALDLVGFGASSKPRSRLAQESEGEGWMYGLDSWAMQVRDFILENIDGPVQLLGNSIGGVVALNAARFLELAQRPARQVILIDCAQRALDDKRLADQPPLRRFGRPALKACVRQRWLTTRLFNLLAKPAVIRKVLLQAYPSGQGVDDELVDLLLRPALEPNAAEAFRGFINLFDDWLAPDLLQQIATPVAMVWGERDPWEPIDVAKEWQHFQAVKSLDVLPGLGHCPHDEDPSAVNAIVAELLKRGDS